MARKRFRMLTVPAEFHSQIQFHEKLCLKLGAATDPKEIEDLFSQLCYARQYLYEYVEDRCGRMEGEAISLLRFL